MQNPDVEQLIFELEKYLETDIKASLEYLERPSFASWFFFCFVFRNQVF